MCACKRGLVEMRTSKSRDERAKTYQKRTSFDHPVMNSKQILHLSILNQERQIFFVPVSPEMQLTQRKTAQEMKLQRDSPTGKKLNLFFFPYGEEIGHKLWNVFP